MTPQDIVMLEDVKVQVLSFSELFSRANFPLALDTYQRPYVWGYDKVGQLIDDLQKYCRNRDEEQPLDYYMGALLLHKNDEKQKLFIVDGQQRLTSLSVLYHLLTNDLPVNHALRSCKIITWPISFQ